MSYYWLEVAKTIQSIAQSGLTYCNNKYDIERYEQLRDLSVKIMSKYSECDMEIVRNLFANENGYQTPKIDIRAVVLRDNKILMVKEELDGCWSLPGGWADIGYTPSEVAVKEVSEESGFLVRPIRLLGILDKKCHPHPPSPYHVYKVFILCEIIDGELSTGLETTDVDFFSIDNLPELSVERNTKSQIIEMFKLVNDSEKSVLLD